MSTAPFDKNSKDLEKPFNRTAEVFNKLDREYQKEKQFKDKLLEILKKHNIGSAEDMAFLEGLAA